MVKRQWLWAPVLLFVAAFGWLFVSDYLQKAETRRDDQRQVAVERIKRVLDRRGIMVPAVDGSLRNREARTEATGGLAKIGAAPERPKDTVVNYAVDPSSKAYFVCTFLERGGAFYANRHGTFSGPAESCRQDADPAAVDYVLDTKMTSAGATAFLRADPAFVSKPFIQRKCAATSDDGQLQGCFTGNRIYLIDLPQQEIRPEVSVTAVHEMLHAAWESLGTAERQRLTGLLQDLVRRNPELKEAAASYEPAARIKEIHSIAGTEQMDVGTELERHYARYLRDRKLVVRRHLSYEKVLDDLTAEIERLKAELIALERRAETLMASGDIDTYNAFVEEYNARAPELVDAINARVDRFNRLTEHTRPDGRVPTVRAR